MSKRGEVKDEKLFKQSLLFKGLQWDKITPTDIDGCLEFNDKVFIFFEVKYQQHEMGIGQRLLFERLVKRINKSGAIATALVCKHNTHQDILLKDCIVSDVYFYKWNDVTDRNESVEQVVLKIIDKHLKDKNYNFRPDN